MPKYTFVRCAPLAITVEAENENEAWVQSGNRLDDFFTDVTNGGPFLSHSQPQSFYSVVYHGDAIYPERL